MGRGHARDMEVETSTYHQGHAWDLYNNDYKLFGTHPPNTLSDHLVLNIW